MRPFVPMMSLKKASEGISFLKDVTDKRHEHSSETHFDQKANHEDLKVRHYIIKGQLELLKEALGTE